MPFRGPILLWFRRDLRLYDNPALNAALGTGGPVVPVFILEDAATDPWCPGGAGRWWLHHSLAALDAQLQRLGNRLVLRRGDPGPQLVALAAATGARGVFWNQVPEPHLAERDQALALALARRGIATASFPGALLFDPAEFGSASGRFYRVFAPFWRTCQNALPPAAPLPAPTRLPAPERLPDSDRLDDWHLCPTAPDWAGGLSARWRPGEAAAEEVLQQFLSGAATDYAGDRDRPGYPGTSRLSPHLHWGEISPRRVWHAAQTALAVIPPGQNDAGTRAFLRQLGWREFCHHLLHHLPGLAEHPLDSRFAAFPWQPNPALLRAWQQGRTGYPFVDAGMRELWASGWMHNRTRMVTASFLVKHLLQPWQSGAAWFWDTLVDAGLACNAVNWQWVAGCGTDAAPFFRIFNPVLQGQRFDPDGGYVRRWVPELGGLPDKWLHQPWRAPQAELARARIRLGETYPLPLVAHEAARLRALSAFRALPR